MTTKNRDSTSNAKTYVRPAEYTSSSDWHPEGWPSNPLKLPDPDRPIVGGNLAALARQIDPDRPSRAAKQMLDLAKTFRMSVSQPIIHRFFALERDAHKKKPGVKNKSGHEAKDEWTAKTADYQAVAKAAFCLINGVDKAEGLKWSRFEEQVFEGTSFLPPGREKKTPTNIEIVYGLFERLQRMVLNTSIETFWTRLADTPFEVKWASYSEEWDEKVDAPIQTRPNLSDEKVLSLSLGKLVRGDPLSDKWCIGDVNPDANLYWSEVSIELGRIAVPKEIWVLEIPQDLQSHFTREAAEIVPLPGFEDDESETMSRFPPAAHAWLLEEGWGGEIPESQWDVLVWAENQASPWAKRTFGFDCRLMLTVSRDTEGSVQTTLEVRPRRMDDGRGLLDAHYSTRDELAKQLRGAAAGPDFDIHRMNEDFWPEVIYSSGQSELPEFWTALELQAVAEDLRRTFVLDQLGLADANEHLSSYTFYPTIAVAETGGTRQFAEYTVLHALFANLALGDCPQRIDRMLEAQAKAIRDFGNAHLDELVDESDALLAELDKAIGGQP